MIILTGGAGFIGSCLLKRLNDEGMKDILVVDHLGNEYKWKNLVSKRFTEYLHKEQFRANLNKGLYNNQVEAIFHMGACSTTTERNADYMLDNNFNYSKELALFAAENDIPFIYASSAATYGDGENGYSDLEFESLRPLNVYGLSKHLFDLWLIDNKLDQKFTGLKFFNVFGPNEYHKSSMASMVYRSFYQIKEHSQVKLFKSYLDDYKHGEQKRDFIYVKDVCEVMMQIYKKKDFAGIYNLGTGHAHTWNELASAVFKAMNKDIDIEYIEMPDSLKNQYQYFTQADMDKLKKELPELKFNSLEENVPDYVQSHLDNNWQHF